MAKHLEKLAKETALYGVSSILGKFLNWMMVPLYTYVLQKSSDYGIVTNLYSWTTLLLVVLTYGMESGFLRFANKHSDQSDKVYSTTLISVGFTSLLFALTCIFFRQPIAGFLGYPNHSEFIALLAAVVAMDAFGAIPYVYLRYKNRPVRFVAINMLGIFANIVLNIFFLIICPWLMNHYPASVDWFYHPDYGVGYVFLANILSTALVTIALLFDVFVVKFEFDFQLWKQMLRYSLPLLVLGIALIMNQTLDKILFPFLRPGEAGQSELGIYGATSKMALIIVMFTQAFRNSYEPIFFSQKKSPGSTETYADAMKFYVQIALFFFLGMVLFLDIFKYIIRADYWVGLKIVPVVMMSYLFQGVFFNLSIWYKINDKTLYGAWFSLIGTIIIVALNFLLVPRFSYTGSAWAAFFCYLTMMLIAFVYSQKYMPVRYDFKTIGLYTGVAVIISVVSFFINTPHRSVNLLLKSVLMAGYITLLIRRDWSLTTIPVINRFFKNSSKK